MTYIDKNFYRVKNNGLFIFLEYFFVILTILQCNSIYMHQINIGFIGSLIKWAWILTLIILISVVLMSIKFRIYNSFVKYISLPLFLMLIVFIIDCFNYKIDYNIFLFYIVIPSLVSLLFLLLYQCNLFNSIFYLFERIILLLSLISLFFWILYLIHIPTNSNVSVMWGTNSQGVGVINNASGYFDIDFFPQDNIKFLGFNTVRNTGVFMEASIFATVLLVALLTELFLRNNNRIFNFKVILLLITIISTTSTDGMIVAVFAIAYAECISVSHKYNIFYIIPIIFIGILLIYMLLNEKSNSLLTSSFYIRHDDMKATLDAWKSHILIGNGIDNNKAIINHMSLWRFFVVGSNTDVTVGFTKILAYGGIIFGLFFLLPVIFSFFYSFNMIGLSLSIFLLFILEGIDVFYIYNIIIMFLWVKYSMPSVKI